MKVLIGCERSGIVRDAFAARGHFAVSCDLEPTERPGPHWRGDIFEILPAAWDLAILHPECKYIAGSGLHWNKRVEGRQEKSDAALQFVRDLFAAASHIPRVAIENPVGRIGTEIMPATQWVQPHEFGEDASKKTGLWLRGLPRLVPTLHVRPRVVDGKKRWANQTDSGQNRLSPSETRSIDRARTYQGIADAMAAQWGGHE
jgi:hypothetical protein